MSCMPGGYNCLPHCLFLLLSHYPYYYVCLRPYSLRSCDMFQHNGALHLPMDSYTTHAPYSPPCNLNMHAQQASPAPVRFWFVCITHPSCPCACTKDDCTKRAPPAPFMFALWLSARSTPRSVAHLTRRCACMRRAHGALSAPSAALSVRCCACACSAHALPPGHHAPLPT